MGKINLPVRFLIHQEDNLELKNELVNQFNRIKNDLEHISSNYVDETELMTYYKNHSIYFKKIANLIKTYFENNKLFDKCEELIFYLNIQKTYICVADEIACYFEEFKANLEPSIDLESALALRINQNSNSLDIINYTEINRLIKIFLLKENLAGIDYFVENGILNIKTKLFDLKLTLCGDINNPSWKLFDVNRQNKVPFLMELPSNIKFLIPLIKIYEGKIEAKEIFNLFNEDRAFNGLLKGNIYDFDFDFILNLRVKINSKGITAIVAQNNQKVYFKKDILKKYENEIKDFFKNIHPEINFSFKDKITINQHRFTNLVDLNEYLFTQKTRCCFYNIFESYNSCKFEDFKKEEFGKNVTFFLKKNFLIFKLEKIHFDESELLKSMIYVTVYICKYIGENFLKKELFINTANTHKFTNIYCEKERISIETLKNLINSSIIYFNNLYELAILNYEIEIVNNELQIKEFNLTIKNNNDHFLINQKYKISDLCQIFTFFRYLKLKNFFKTNDFFLFKNILFEDKIVIESENNILEKYLPLRTLETSLNLLYNFISTNMFPSFVTQDFIIFEFKIFLDQNFYFKVEEAQLLLVKTDFILENFSLPVLNSTYFICDPKNAVFFNEFKSFYFKERFVRLAFELKNEFDVQINNLEIIVKYKKMYIFILVKNVFSIKFMNEDIPRSANDKMVEAFYKNQNYVEIYREIIRKY